MQSQVNIYVDLLELLLRSDPCNLESAQSLDRDVNTLRIRTRDEGVSFLTKTLPLLGKSFDFGLANLSFSRPRRFKSAKSSSMPAFMQGYFKEVFSDSGLLLDNANPEAVKHLRQVLFFGYKLEMPYESSQVSQVIENFVNTDGELEDINDVEALEIIEVASYIAKDVFHDFDHEDIIPRHGPGSVATGEILDDKWEFSRLYDSIHQVYPYYKYFMIGSGNELIDRKEWYMNLTRLNEGQAKVITVPKDSRGPRLISSEPLEYQWIQQGLGRGLSIHLESNKFTMGQINFTHQEINQALALESSYSLRNATIDLKDASDRVSTDLVERVFSKLPSLKRALLACRSSSTILPDGRLVQLRKYAPMGSALCFPVEAFVFWAILVAAISRYHIIRKDNVSQADVMREVYVYGDDIVVPTKYSSLCLQTLESVNLRVNVDKCCIHGPFRESCGVDAFRGVNVTPIRLKRLWSGHHRDGSALASYTSIANKLSDRGYDVVADYIWKLIEKTYGVMPFGTSRSSYPCRIVIDPQVAEFRNLRLFKARYSRRYQQVQFRFLKLRPKKSRTKLDSWPRLLKDMVFEPVEDPSLVVRPHSTEIKRGWAATS